MTADTTWRYCDRCNYDMHTCPGCGTSLPHGMELCPRCEWEVTR